MMSAGGERDKTDLYTREGTHAYVILDAIDHSSYLSVRPVTIVKLHRVAVYKGASETRLH